MSKILDTTIGETGSENEAGKNLLDSDKALRFHCYLGSGDTVLIEGKVREADSYQTLYTFDADNLGPIDLYVSPFFRARRSVDGGSGDSSVSVSDNSYTKLVEHE